MDIGFTLKGKSSENCWDCNKSAWWL